VSDLIHELELLAADVEWPATPQLAPRGAAHAPVHRRRRRPHRRLALALALGVLALAAAALAATGVIHVGSGVTIHRVEQLPPVDPAPTLGLGAPIRVAEARRLMPAPLPPRLRSPDAAYRDDRGIAYLYLGPHGPRAILSVYREGPQLIDKLVSIATDVRRVRVQGARGIYVPDVHVVDFLYGPGRRLSRPTLLWARGSLTYRLESADALALASAR
jgi:hypothetical protein